MNQIVTRARILGYCMGVRRAVETAEKCITDYPGKKIYSFGPLIHNSRALQHLESLGLQVLPADDQGIESIDPADNPVVIIRAHGVPPQTRDKLAAKNCIIVDATCPRVVANQKKASLRAAEGYTVIIAGDKNHGEVMAVEGSARYAGAPETYLVATSEEAEALPITEKLEDHLKVLLLSQTTFSSKVYTAIARTLSIKLPSIEVVDTICPATRERQDALWELSEQVDGIIVVGGKNSANTRRLYTTAASICGHVWHIESADEIPEEFFSLPRVGITAGASTPDFIIAEVENALQRH